MGYSHYYEYGAMSEGHFRAIVADVERLRASALAALGVKSGSSVNFELQLFELNGEGDEGFEPFEVIGGDMNERRSWAYNPSFHCCKTMRLPYDVIVAAGLIAMKHHMGDAVSLGSDGSVEERDWDKAFRLYHETFPDRPPPPMPFFGTHEEYEARYKERGGEA